MNLYFRVCWGWDYLPNFHRLCQAVLILEFDSVAVTPENHRQQFTLVGLRMYAAMRTDAGPAVLTCRLDACVHMHVYTCPNPVHSSTIHAGSGGDGGRVSCGRTGSQEYVLVYRSFQTPNAVNAADSRRRCGAAASPAARPSWHLPNVC